MAALVHGWYSLRGSKSDFCILDGVVLYSFWPILNSECGNVGPHLGLYVPMTNVFIKCYAPGTISLLATVQLRF